MERPAPLVFGLPGNPVSALVGFLLFIKPALRVLAGGPAQAPEPEQLPLGAAVRPPRRPPDLSSRAAGRAVRDAWQRVSSRSWTGPARPTWWALPGPTAWPSSLPATGFSSQEKLSISCRSAKMSAHECAGCCGWRRRRVGRPALRDDGAWHASRKVGGAGHRDHGPGASTIASESITRSTE